MAESLISVLGFFALATLVVLFITDEPIVLIPFAIVGWAAVQVPNGFDQAGRK